MSQGVIHGKEHPSHLDITRTIKEKTVDMFSPQTGNIVVTHYDIRVETFAADDKSTLAPTPIPLAAPAAPEEVVYVMDIKDPEWSQGVKVAESQGGAQPSSLANEILCPADDDSVPETMPDAETEAIPEATPEPLNVLNLLSSLRCDICAQADLADEAALQSHLTTQHPQCGHCSQGQHFQDIPKILTHFKTCHKNLKRCKVLIANEILTLAMGNSFHG